MRVLFAVFPVAAHVFPVVPLAWALRNAGHEVRIATHPDTARVVTGAGLAAVPVGRGEDLAALTDFARNPVLSGLAGGGLDIGPGDCDDWGAKWFRTTRVFPALRPLLEELTGVAVRWRPDLVLWDPFCLPAAVAARVSGAAHARLLWGRDNIAWLYGRSVRYRHQAPDGGWPEPLEETMQQILEPYGLTFEEELVLGQWTVDPMPPGMRLPVPAVRYESVRWVPYGGGQAVPEWLHGRPSRPRVCVTLGAGEPGRLLLRENGTGIADVLDSLAGLDVELVAAVDPGSAESRLPERVRVLERIPLPQLLPGCAAVVHHGAAETLAPSAAAGVPQLIVPVPSWDEDAAAAHLVRNGAGVVLDRREFSPRSLRAALAELLRNPSFQEAATAWREELARLPGPADLVPVLEELTGHHQRF
ncbi:nucleotide disphospho-sugar-binding domain-containing protein [Streptomyces cyanogenus]|uniref:Desosaminyl transferase EryCIII n=1 Tax=Streptomyces cyanogenus TaxID=80860 RepID=A0ABX7U4L2_STRCY|nr:nucleotide disphospho-sugar-binding domain-containing protein [Streptomyces cyanogenus]QTE03034.1 Desosaminyl transferase EryCIII precursor [Streptomyces cyanogenus]